MRNYFALVAALTLLAMPLGVEASKYIRAFGTVQSVDHAKNEISVKDQTGQVHHFTVDPRTEVEVEERATHRDYDTTFSEVKVGDIVDVKAYTTTGGQKALAKDIEITR